MGFSSKQKAFCVENYSLLRSPKQVQLLFCKKYGLDSRSRSGIPTYRQPSQLEGGMSSSMFLVACQLVTNDAE